MHESAASAAYPQPVLVESRPVLGQVIWPHPAAEMLQATDLTQSAAWCRNNEVFLLAWISNSAVLISIVPGSLEVLARSLL